MPTKPFTSNYKQTILLIQNIQEDAKSQLVPLIKIPNVLPYNTIRVEEMSKSISDTTDTTNLTSNNNSSLKIAPYNSCSNIYNTSVINCPFPPPPPLYHGNWSK
jgi:hypothetical protein